MSRIWTLIVLLTAGCNVSLAGPKLTYIDLVNRLSDLERLAVLPELGERCAQCSSYDRTSRYDEQAGMYVGWGANGDGACTIRQEGDTFVLAEMQGPGCIWRIWSARPQEGHVRIYLDGATEPVVDLPFMGYFDGKNEPFNRPGLVHEAATGYNSYVPIPYQKSCRIVADKQWGCYYHFTYGTFGKDTIVPTFRRKLTPEQSAALDRADQGLQNCGVDPAGKRDGQITETKTVEIASGQTLQIMELTGPRAITSIRVRLRVPPVPEDRDVLREMAISIQWDDLEQPGVWAPLGDFFGTAAGANAYRSLPLGMTTKVGNEHGSLDTDAYCFWYMPFAKKAVVKLSNHGGSSYPREVTFEITHAPLTRPMTELMYFHAKWHRDAFVPWQLYPDRWPDWPMLVTRGRGRFCGVMLHVFNPKGGWWGEGDEKFFVDGEKFPSTFGTGSEDYFGYAWGKPILFQQAYHNQTLCEGDNRGHVSVNRWHIPDNVPFATSFEACIEKYRRSGRPTSYACVAYWYLAADGVDPYDPCKPVPVAQRIRDWEPVYKQLDR